MAPSDALNTFAVCLSYLGFSNARRVVVHVWREVGGPVLSLHVYRPCLLKWPPGPAAGQCCHYGKGIRVCQGVGTLEGSSLNCVPLAGGPVRGRTSLTSAPHHPKEGQAWLGGMPALYPSPICLGLESSGLSPSSQPMWGRGVWKLLLPLLGAGGVLRKPPNTQGCLAGVGRAELAQGGHGWLPAGCWLPWATQSCVW